MKNMVKFELSQFVNSNVVKTDKLFSYMKLLVRKKNNKIMKTK